jgi:deoxyhypusine synthase
MKERGVAELVEDMSRMGFQGGQLGTSLKIWEISRRIKWITVRAMILSAAEIRPGRPFP